MCRTLVILLGLFVLLPVFWFTGAVLAWSFPVLESLKLQIHSILKIGDFVYLVYGLLGWGGSTIFIFYVIPTVTSFMANAPKRLTVIAAVVLLIIFILFVSQLRPTRY